MRNDFSDLTLVITGPTYVREEIKKAALLPEFGHRDSEAKKRLEPAMTNLKHIMCLSPHDPDYNIVLFPGTGSLAMEASIASLVAPGETVLCVSVGAFGDLYEQIALSHTPNVMKLKFQDGKPINLGILEDVLAKYKPGVVTFTHNETSTGVINDVEAVGKLIRKYNALPLVDGVSILGGAPTKIKEGNIAMYVSSTQKCLGLPAGFGIAAISKEANEKAKSLTSKLEMIEEKGEGYSIFIPSRLTNKGKDMHTRGHVTDIVENIKLAEQFQTLTTTPSTLANQLYVQTKYIVEEEGIENRFARHKEMRDITIEWIKTLPDGFELFSDLDYASPSLTCIKVPENLDRKLLKESLEKEKNITADGREMTGYLFDPGYKKLKTPTIRIGHMGDITKEMLMPYLDTIKRHLTSILDATLHRVDGFLLKDYKGSYLR